MVEWPTRAQQSHRGRKAWRGEGREWCGRTSDRRERGASVAVLAAPRRFSAVALRARAGTKRRTPPEAGLAQRARVGQWDITSRGILFATVPDALCGSGIETPVSGAGPASGARSERQRAEAIGIEAEIGAERRLQRRTRPEGIARRRHGPSPQRTRIDEWLRNLAGEIAIVVEPRLVRAMLLEVTDCISVLLPCCRCPGPSLSLLTGFAPLPLHSPLRSARTEAAHVAARARTCPWQGSGAHQQASGLP